MKLLLILSVLLFPPCEDEGKVISCDSEKTPASEETLVSRSKVIYVKSDDIYSIVINSLSDRKIYDGEMAYGFFGDYMFYRHVKIINSKKKGDLVLQRVVMTIPSAVAKELVSTDSGLKIDIGNVRVNADKLTEDFKMILTSRATTKI